MQERNSGANNVVVKCQKESAFEVKFDKGKRKN